jgi:hypothetical protein
MSHHGQVPKDILNSGILIIKGTKNPTQLKLRGTTLYGNRGYNDCECFHLIEESDMEFLNTTKCGPSLVFKFVNIN